MSRATSQPRGADEVRSRSVSGVKALSVRTLFSLALRAASSLALARLLFPRDYGVFGVASYLTGLGLFLSDVGLGGALVRQREKPTEDETFTVFVSQQVITGVIVAGVIVCAPLATEAYRLTPAAGLLLRVMALGLFFSSLRVVPMMALERDLEFAVVARCEMIENVAQTASTILLAACGAGAWALAGGGLIRGAVGLACVWAASPWRPRGRFRWPIVVALARFGIVFQLAALLPTLIGGWLPLAVSRLLGVAALGLVNWAINLASIPQMLSAVLFRVAFPALSRLQADLPLLLASVRASMRRVGTGLSLAIPVGVILIPALIGPVFGRRWLPAAPLVQWFCIEAMLLTLNGLVCAAQSAAGYAGDRLGVTIITGLARFLLGYTCIARYGIYSIGPSQAAAAGLELYVSLVALRRRLGVEPIHPWEVFGPLLRMGGALALALGAGALAARAPVPRAGASLAVFAALVLLYALLDKRRTLISEVRGLARTLARSPQPQEGA